MVTDFYTDPECSRKAKNPKCCSSLEEFRARAVKEHKAVKLHNAFDVFLVRATIKPSNMSIDSFCSEGMYMWVQLSVLLCIYAISQIIKAPVSTLQNKGKRPRAEQWETEIPHAGRYFLRCRWQSIQAHRTSWTVETVGSRGHHPHSLQSL